MQKYTTTPTGLWYTYFYEAAPWGRQYERGLNRVRNMAQQEHRAGFEQLVRDVMQEYDAAGVAVAVVDQKETLYQNFFGFQDVEEQIPLNEDTIMGMASVSKSFTALAVMQLAEDGRIDLDGPVSRYIPEFRNCNQSKEVKVWHLLCHAGGFLPQRRMLVQEVAQQLGIWQDGQNELGPHAGLAALGTQLVCQRLDEDKNHTGIPGEYMSYSNDSYGLLSELVRRYGGEDSYATFVEKRILKPLQMHRSTALFIEPAKAPNSTKLYYHKDGQRLWCRDYYDNAFVLMGGGAIKSTVADLKHYLRMYLSGGKGPQGQRILSEQGIREMGKPKQHYRYGQYYGYGLSTQQVEGYTMVGHGGSMTGISNYFAWSPQLGVGVMVLCNTTGVPASLLAEEAMRWFGGHSVPAPRTQWQDAGWSAQQVAAACGTYHSAEGAQIELYENAGKIAMKLGGQEKACIAAFDDMLVLPGKFADSDVLLLADEARGVWGLRYGGRILSRVK